MDQNGIGSFRHRRSPSSDRFLGVFSPSKPGSALAASGDSSAAGDELNEDDVFWTGDFTEPQQRPSPSQNSLRQPFRQSEKFGILAALPEDHHRNPNQPLLYRKASLSPSSSASLQKSSPGSAAGSPTSSFSRPIPAIPKPQNFNGYSQSMPVRKFQQSAPVNVPMMPRKPKNSLLADVDVDDDADDEMLPPHEIVARGSAARSPKTTFSVLEGVGRTLKGRDLRQVRNAVWRQTGFLD
ncbi:hypothetical protein M9H77_14747 [Catharanthus roseus]|uniref:Uncharacterized protein n=1 Tax=Catharanthus roseus TaxID=4058 RepID=A0ACC0BP66_CATRO|nr:hypothetical protein M9H77_14747 [Catharanthus roseus]